MYAPYLERELRLSAAILGGIFAVTGVGGLLGASLAATIANRAGLRGAMVGGMPTAALAEMVIAVAQGPILLAATLVPLGEAGGQGGDVVASIANRSARQRVVSDASQGRVTAALRVPSTALAAPGVIVGGWIAGVGTVMATIWLWSSPVAYLREVAMATSQTEQCDEPSERISVRLSSILEPNPSASARVAHAAFIERSASVKHCQTRSDRHEHREE